MEKEFEWSNLMLFAVIWIIGVWGRMKFDNYKRKK